MKKLRPEEAVRMWRDGQWEPATVLEKADEPRSYTLRTEYGRTYRRNRSHILKTKVDDDDDHEKETSEENVTVQSDDTLKDVKWEESGVNDTNERENSNDTIEPKKITSSGRLLRRPKRYDDSCIWIMVKLVNMFTSIYIYSPYGIININYGKYVLL